uniref:Uncharacterized protein n=1 Tax=Arundo donax TaxID=35708 RepID=A0A0A9BH46_ARUDO
MKLAVCIKVNSRLPELPQKYMLDQHNVSQNYGRFIL